jgi:hypothetical protein
MNAKLKRTDDAPGALFSTRTRNARKLTRLYFLATMTLLLAIPSRAQQSMNILTGLPIYFGNQRLHVQGQPINAYLIVVSLYPMNTPPPWPVGLWLNTYVQSDASPGIEKSTWGQGQWCRWWFNEVQQVESQNSQDLPFPYLEVNVPTTVQPIQTDEGIPVYPAGSVTCWQASNDFPPI